MEKQQEISSIPTNEKRPGEICVKAWFRGDLRDLSLSDMSVSAGDVEGSVFVENIESAESELKVNVHKKPIQNAPTLWKPQILGNLALISVICSIPHKSIFHVEM